MGKQVNQAAEVVKISDVSVPYPAPYPVADMCLVLRSLFPGLLKQDKQMGDNDKLHRPHIRKTEHKRVSVEMV